MTVAEDVVELTATERKFCKEYFSGEHAGNGTRSYLAIFPEASYDRASVAASELLKQHRVARFLQQLHQKAMEGLTEALKPWLPLAVKAQRKLENHLDGIERLSGTDLAVIREVLDRACGKAKETLEFDTGERISKIIKELTERHHPRFRAREMLPAGVVSDDGGSGERSES